MAAPVDLTDMFGEGWCVTLARTPPREALMFMGVDTPSSLPNGLEEVTDRLTARRWDQPREPDVLLLARQAAPKWTLVLELEGTTGWIGMDHEVLALLSTELGKACSIMSDPNRQVVLFAEDGQVRVGLDPLTARRWGTPSTQLAEALTSIGFPEDDDGEMADALARRTSSQRAVLAAQAATGVQLTTETFNNPWLGGLSTGG
jgi:hypothetical protein